MVLSFSSRAPPIETVAIERIMTMLRLVTLVVSIMNLRELAQFIRCRGAEPEEFEIGRNLLEQHVGSHLVVAALGARGGQEWRDLVLHHDLADKGRRGNS